jgi:predicted amidohydrolase
MYTEAEFVAALPAAVAAAYPQETVTRTGAEMVAVLGAQEDAGLIVFPEGVGMVLGNESVYYPYAYHTAEEAAAGVAALAARWLAYADGEFLI